MLVCVLFLFCLSMVISGLRISTRKLPFGCSSWQWVSKKYVQLALLKQAYFTVCHSHVRVLHDWLLVSFLKYAYLYKAEKHGILLLRFDLLVKILYVLFWITNKFMHSSLVYPHFLEVSNKKLVFDVLILMIANFGFVYREEAVRIFSHPREVSWSYSGMLFVIPRKSWH